MTTDLNSLIDAIAGTRILVVGDVMLDRFIHGRVDRISPEAPIPVLRVQRETAMPGGAGNVVANMVALGVEADLISVVGDDAAGQELSRLMLTLNGQRNSLLTSTNRPTTTKTRFVAGGQQLLRADAETDIPLSDADATQLLALAATKMPDVSMLVLSDYNKGVLTSEVSAALIELARAAGVRVLVDPKGRDYARYRGAYCVTPNMRELADATGIMPADTASLVATARTLANCHGIAAVVATRSEQGMSVVPADGAATHLYARAREVFDVSGAGDTVVAVLAAALTAGADLVEAATLANVAAGVVVAKVGTATVRPNELRDALGHAIVAGPGSKSVTLDQAVEQVERWRRQGLRVGFTNGCFDLLHPGHVSLIAQARAQCDRLVLGLNSDDSVRRLKGPARPVQNVTSRATVLSALGDVDLVVTFADDTPLTLIKALRPDILVKGADYKIDDVVGAKEVMGWGGRVVLADLAAGHSTTNTIERMK
ncbi:bifunctional heptose 7-phosphate kinase/heptose 1-phosphate adenyltransferase [Niveispirillum lacus]|uniref:Bifunctional protein HldE n=1 Tax=Niveispirillum lacus TaxID=1981099 RepID=A0A255Z1C6_9PROT|nr:D-glycero-beta-D-manno-heptose-7-phosphate kinase [Niveispirillum lacus]OYQ35303.1 bifunctional heptose 7-phosphate kinase/heptose 1-phosphate adenyltransferase [Niveispirillum lacus]